MITGGLDRSREAPEIWTPGMPLDCDLSIPTLQETLRFGGTAELLAAVVGAAGKKASSAGGGGTDPSTLTGLTAYFVESTLNTKNTVPTPDTLSSYHDQTGGAHPFAQATEANQPQWASTGAATAGSPQFDASNDNLKGSSPLTYLGASGYGTLLVWEPSGVQAAKGAASYDAPSLWAGSGAYQTLCCYGSGGQNYLNATQNTAVTTGLTSVPVPSTGKLVIANGWDGASLWCKYAGTSASVAVASMASTAGFLYMGGSWNLSKFLGGTVWAAYFYNAAKGVTDLDDGITWLQSAWSAT